MVHRHGVRARGHARSLDLQMPRHGSASAECHRAGNRRKLKYTDVMAYKTSVDQKRLQVLEELSELDQSLGLGY